jgi:prevent-host-death family protein
MSIYSIVDAESRLAELIDRALAGESVVITRHGRPVVELRSIEQFPSRVSSADLDWLEAHRVGNHAPPIDAGTLVSDMRDEDDRC